MMMSVNLVLLLVFITFSSAKERIKSQKNRKRIAVLASTHGGGQNLLEKCALVPVKPCRIIQAQASRRQGEMAMWIYWIIQHYHSLPEHVVFLHDSNRYSWHRNALWETYVASVKPKRRFSLGAKLSDGNKVFDDEVPCVNALLAVANITGSKSTFVKDGYCCTESIISRESLHQYSIEQYRHWLELTLGPAVNSSSGSWSWTWILGKPGSVSCDKWGFAWERVMAHVFGAHEQDSAHGVGQQ